MTLHTCSYNVLYIATYHSIAIDITLWSTLAVCVFGSCIASHASQANCTHCCDNIGRSNFGINSSNKTEVTHFCSERAVQQNIMAANTILSMTLYEYISQCRVRLSLLYYGHETTNDLMSWCMNGGLDECRYIRPQAVPLRTLIRRSHERGSSNCAGSYD